MTLILAFLKLMGSGEAKDNWREPFNNAKKKINETVVYYQNVYIITAS